VPRDKPVVERWKVEAITKELDADSSGKLSDDEIRALLAKLSGRMPTAIADDHPDLVAYRGLSTDDLTEKLSANASKETIDRYYEVLFDPKETGFIAQRPDQPDRGLVKQIVDHLDKDDSGMLSRDEIKGLFSAISGVPSDDIDDEHPQLIAFCDITTGELIHKLWSQASKQKMLDFHATLGLVYHREATLLQPHPDRERCAKIVAAVDKDGDGNISRKEVKKFLGSMCQVSPDKIDDDNEEYKLFADLTNREMEEVLYNRVSKDTVDRYYYALYPSLFREGPDRSMMEKIVEIIDTNNDGVVSLEEITLLFAKLAGLPLEEVSDHNSEVMSYAGLTTTEVIEKLSQTISKDTAEKYYALLFPTIFNEPADRLKVEAVVNHLDVDGDGCMSLEELRVLFGKVLGIPAEEVPADDKDVQAFVGLPVAEMVDKMCSTVPKDTIEKYHAILFPQPSLLNPRPDKEKIREFVLKMDTSGDGRLSKEEVKVLVARILDMPPEEIGDDHKEVVSMAGLEIEELVETLHGSLPRETVDRYHDAVCNPPSLLNPRPDPTMVTKIVRAMDLSEDGSLSVEEVKAMLGKLLSVPVANISDDHPEVVSMAGLSIDELVEKLCNTVSRDTVERYYEAMFRSTSLLNPPADKRKVARIVHALDSDSDGKIMAAEVKVLFSKILDIPVADIPDDHTEVAAYAGSTVEEMVDKLAVDVPKEVLDRYHDALFPPTNDLLRQQNVARVSAIVKSLDKDGTGELSLEELKPLVGIMLGLPADAIDDDNAEVLTFYGVSMDAMPDRIIEKIPMSKVDSYYYTLFPGEDPANDKTTLELFAETEAKRLKEETKVVGVDMDPGIEKDLAEENLVAKQHVVDAREAYARAKKKKDEARRRKARKKQEAAEEEKKREEEQAPAAVVEEHAPAAVAGLEMMSFDQLKRHMKYCGVDKAAVAACVDKAAALALCGEHGVPAGVE